MDLTVVQYLAFIIISLLLIWAAIGFNRRLSRQNRPRPGRLGSWVELDTKSTEAREEEPAKDADLDEEITEQHARAKQNGHHAESQRPQP